MTGVTREVPDPETGEPRYISVYTTKGRLAVRDVTASVGPDAAPRKLETRANFAESASRAYGRARTGELPAAAEQVRVDLRGRRDLLLSAPTSQRAQRRAELVGMLGEEEAAAMARLVAPERPTPSAIGRRNLLAMGSAERDAYLEALDRGRLARSKGLRVLPSMRPNRLIPSRAADEA